MMSDLINRQDAIRAVANYLWHYPNEQYKNLNVFEIAESLAKDALSVVPSEDRPTGKWVWSDEDASWKCGRCDCVFDEIDWKPNYNFCPNCGAKMRGEEK